MEHEKATDEMLGAYEAGKKCGDDWFLSDEAMTVFGDVTLNAFFEAGRGDYPMPHWVTGWRYGEIPEAGRSVNHADDCYEPGVSLMALDDGPSVEGGSFELFNPNRPRIKVGGWLVTHITGSDGEPLVAGAVTI